MNVSGRERAGLVSAAVVAIAVFVPACGGGASPNSVGHIAEPGTTTTLVAAGSGAASGTRSENGHSEALAFAQCMRSHGVPDFPNPTGNSGVAFPRGDLKVTESRLQTAEDDCQHLLPSGGQPFHAEQQQESDELNFARCVRSHGVPDWPDPTNMGGGEYEFNLRLVGIDPNSPQAEAAERECQSQLHLSRSQLHLPQTGPTTGGVKVAGEP